MLHPQHHLNIRKRVHQKSEAYPNPDKLKRIVDKIIILISVIVPVMTLPQVWQIFSTKSAAGVSLASWITYTVSSVFWLLYGILHREMQIILLHALLFIVNTMVVIGTIIYA